MQAHLLAILNACGCDCIASEQQVLAHWSLELRGCCEVGSEHHISGLCVYTTFKCTLLAMAIDIKAP